MRDQLQNSLNPEYFRPVVETQMSGLKSSMEAEFEKVYAMLEQKTSSEAVERSLQAHFNDVALELQRLAKRLQEILRLKADADKVNEAL